MKKSLFLAILFVLIVGLYIGNFAVACPTSYVVAAPVVQYQTQCYAQQVQYIAQPQVQYIVQPQVAYVSASPLVSYSKANVVASVRERVVVRERQRRQPIRDFLQNRAAVRQKVVVKQNVVERVKACQGCY